MEHFTVKISDQNSVNDYVSCFSFTDVPSYTWLTILFYIKKVTKIVRYNLAQSAGAVEYTDCTSAER